jgi:hypothetical protein
MQLLGEKTPFSDHMLLNNLMQKLSPSETILLIYS